MRTIYLFVIFICLECNSFAQTVIFQKVYNGPVDMGSEWGRYVQQTSDGGYFVAGYSNSFTNGTNDFYIIKTDSIGDTLWTRVYGTVNEDEAFSAQQTSDSGYIVTGLSDNTISNTNILLIKTYSNGDIKWSKFIVDMGYQQAYSIKQTTDSGYILVGSTSHTPAGDYNVYLIKTNSNGDTLWTRSFGGALPDVGYSVQQTTDSGYIIVGYTYDQALVSRDVYLIKTDSNGDTLWTKTYGGVKDDEGNSVQQTTDGGYIITGYTKSVDTTLQLQEYLIKTNSNGDTLWTKVINNKNSIGSEGKSVRQTPDGGYAIAGYHAYSGQWADVYLVKTNSIGDTLWTKTYGGTESDWGFSLDLTKDGGYVIAGSTYNFGGNGGDLKVYLIKTDSLGNTGPSPILGIAEQTPQHSEIKIYPNPFTTQANLILPKEINTMSDAELVVYDIMGNETTRVKITAQRALIERGDLKEGMYFCKVISNNTVIATGKFIIQ